MFIVLGIFAWVLIGIGVGVLDIWYRINYSTSTFWQTTKVEDINREFLGIFWLTVFVWPMIGAFLAFDFYVLSRTWWRDAMDRLAKWIFLKLKRPK
jgi:hypothetical protein